MIVIADDITGAAEIAGIAFNSGQEVRLVIGGSAGSDSIAEKATTVIATDTRSMSEAEAVAETSRIASALHLPSSTLFKKTDSALRGHVVAELVALMQAIGYRRAVYLPANPSKGRIIRNGIYYICEEGIEKPLAETAFSYDPEFPARTSSLRERFPDAEANCIIMPDAENEADIQAIIERYNDGQTLFAGAADLFRLSPNPSLIGRGKITSSQEKTDMQGYCPPPYKGGIGGESLLVCGSTQSRPDAFGLPVSAMPLDIYDGSDNLKPWLDDALPKYANGPIVLSIPYHHRTGKAVAVRLRQLTATLVARLFQHHIPSHLCLEGGATAFAVLQTLHVDSLQVIAQPAPGIVTLQADNGLIITLKPGSYPWGKKPLLFSCSFQK